MSFDNVCKLLAEKYSAYFVRWLTTDDARNVKVLKTELSIEPIRADSVIFIQTSSQIGSPAYMLHLYTPHSALQLLRHVLVTKTRQFRDTTNRNSLTAAT